MHHSGLWRESEGGLRSRDMPVQAGSKTSRTPLVTAWLSVRICPNLLGFISVSEACFIQAVAGAASSSSSAHTGA